MVRVDLFWDVDKEETIWSKYKRLILNLDLKQAHDEC